MADVPERVRVALISGTLDQGGIEKQMVYWARALAGAGTDVRIYCLTHGEFYEGVLQNLGFQCIWVGPIASPVLRLGRLARLLWNFQPHVIQSVHTYTNLYAAMIGRLLDAISIGAIVSSIPYTIATSGIWTRWLISTPTGLLVDSRKAEEDLIKRGVPPERLHFVPSVIDLSEFDRAESSSGNTETGQHETCKVLFVGRLAPVKRPDRFLRALALACREHPPLEGVVVGDGPARKAMEELATKLGLLPGKVTFLGQRDDVAALLKRSHMLILCSDQEGAPVVLLEAMGARLPVVTTPAGDAGVMVQDGVTGYVVPFDDISGMAGRMVRFAKSPDLRRQLGEAGRRRVEQEYSFEGLSDLLLSMYRAVAELKGDRHLLPILPRPSRIPVDSLQE